MTVEQDGDQLECEFRHLSLAEYMTALHVHITGADLKGFPRDRKELILQYLSGLASPSRSKDQMVVQDFLVNMGSTHDARDAMDYLKFVQKMKGEWYNQQGRKHSNLIYFCSNQNNMSRAEASRILRNLLEHFLLCNFNVKSDLLVFGTATHHISHDYIFTNDGVNVR